MALPGQASGGFTESSSDLRILYAGVRNSFSAELTSDAFTQSNPPVVTGSNTVSNQLASSPPDGVLSASVAFTRGAAGNGLIGGPEGSSYSSGDDIVRPLGLFINAANGNDYENIPADASDQGPYVSGQGTMGVRLWETQVLEAASAGASVGDSLDYKVGYRLFASKNGYLTSAASNGQDPRSKPDNTDVYEVDLGNAAGLGEATTMGIVKITADSTHDEMVFDQRI